MVAFIGYVLSDGLPLVSNDGVAMTGASDGATAVSDDAGSLLSVRPQAIAVTSNAASIPFFMFPSVF